MNARTLMLTLVCGLVLLAGVGCTVDGRPGRAGDYLQARMRIAYDVVGWNPAFSHEQRTIPVHPLDGGAGADMATVEVDGALAGARIGLLAAVGPKPLRLVLGTDVRANPAADDDDFAGDLHDHQRQPLPYPYDSFGYALFDPNQYSIIPYVGLESLIADRLLVGIELGLPRTEFTWEKGHERLNEFQIIEKDVSDTQGWSGKIRVTYLLSEDTGYIGLEYAHEHYDAEFSGVDTDIDADVFSIVFEARF